MRRLLKFIPPALVIGGICLVCLARYKIRSICEKYPYDVQITNSACCDAGGPFPQVQPKD